MNILQRLLCLLWPKYKKRQQAIAWLTLEGWEPKILYKRKDSQYPTLVGEGSYILGDGLEVYDVRHAGYPFMPAAWDVISSEDLAHYIVVVEWFTKKGNKPI